MKAKPVNWGIKLFTISEAQTGYVINVTPYVGKQEEIGVAKTAQIVLDVGKHYLGLGHRFVYRQLLHQC